MCPVLLLLLLTIAAVIVVLFTTMKFPFAPKANAAGTTCAACEAPPQSGLVDLLQAAPPTEESMRPVIAGAKLAAREQLRVLRQ
jgi:hypothetical protein